jgi:hypothetical protein
MMAYRITLRKRAIKAREKISDPYYSAIKQAIKKAFETAPPMSPTIGSPTT